MFIDLTSIGCADRDKKGATGSYSSSSDQRWQQDS